MIYFGVSVFAEQTFPVFGGRQVVGRQAYNIAIILLVGAGIGILIQSVTGLIMVIRSGSEIEQGLVPWIGACFEGFVILATLVPVAVIALNNAEEVVEAEDTEEWRENLPRPDNRPSVPDELELPDLDIDDSDFPSSQSDPDSPPESP